MKRLTLGVLDQSPVRMGGTAADALRESVELARVAERLGYHRYWVSEHHNSGGFAGTTPEILIGQIAAHTHTIRVGSGGVMLPHYSAFKVAETFRVLSSFYPGRIDLGIGRAPGSDQLTAIALAYPRQPIDPRHFPRQVVDLIGHLTDSLEEQHPFAQIRHQPGPPSDVMPEIWLLGSSDYSAQLAGMLGLPFAFADFFGHTSSYGPAVADIYRQRFQPSTWLDKPRLNVTVHVICAETEERAHFVASSRNLSKLKSTLGVRGEFLPPEEASAYRPSPYEREVLESFTTSYVDGTPQQVKQGLLEVAERYGTDDLNIVTNCYAFADRMRSYELVAQAFGLTGVIPMPVARVRG